MSKFIISTITMNAGKDIPGSILKSNLETKFKNFDVIVVDGNLTEEAAEFYKKYKNVTVINSPWTGTERAYRNQYEKIWEKIPQNCWFGFLDDDERWCDDLSKILEKNEIEESNFTYNLKGKELDIICVPCILHLSENSQNYFAAESEPPKEPRKDTWTKGIIVRKSERVELDHFGSHVQFKIKKECKDKRIGYIHLPYYHMKSLESFVYNDVWQAFLSPEGQQYDPVQSRWFKLFTSCYKSTKEFKEATKKGTWPPTLKKFAWDNRKDYNHPISRLSWVYFILEGHLMPEIDDFMTWENVKQYVLSKETMAIYNKNKTDNIGITIDEITK